jgi:hypothetical protein
MAVVPLVADTSAPGTSAPGTSAPGTSAPGTSAPGTSAPGTTSDGTLKKEFFGDFQADIGDATYLLLASLIGTFLFEVVEQRFPQVEEGTLLGESVRPVLSYLAAGLLEAAPGQWLAPQRGSVAKGLRVLALKRIEKDLLVLGKERFEALAAERAAARGPSAEAMLAAVREMVREAERHIDRHIDEALAAKT